MSGLKKFKNVIRDPHPKKNVFRILYEVLYWLFVYREFPKFYFGHRLYHREVSNFKDFLSKRESLYLLSLNGKYGKNNLKVYCDNKLLFDRIMNEANLKVPELIGYKISSRLYFTLRSQQAYIENTNNLKEALQIFLQEYSEVFIKPINAYGGKNCFLLTNENLNQVSQKLFTAGDFLVQKRLEQHEDIQKIYPYSINTVRIDSHTDENGNTEILSALIRLGANKSVVDNASSGGFFVNVDIETGRLAEKGVQFLAHGHDVFYKHPDTATILKDYLVPNFDEAKELVIKASRVLPLVVAGWDIAITKEGPVIIEVNDRPMMTMSDTANGGYKINTTLRKLLEM